MDAGAPQRKVGLIYFNN